MLDRIPDLLNADIPLINYLQTIAKAKDSVKVLNLHQINTKASVADLKNTWLEENKIEAARKVSKEVA